jgi:hypothetical protein
MITETNDAFEVDAAALVVAECRSDRASMHLELKSPAVTWTVVIEGSYSLKQDNGGEDRLQTAEIAVLVGQTVLSLRALKADGQLEASFAHAWRLTVYPDDEYESWEMHSSSGERLVSVPGDGVAVWQAMKS